MTQSENLVTDGLICLVDEVFRKSLVAAHSGKDLGTDLGGPV